MQIKAVLRKHKKPAVQLVMALVAIIALAGFANGYTLSGTVKSALDGNTPVVGMKVAAKTGTDSTSTLTDSNGNWSMIISGVEGNSVNEVPGINFNATVLSNPSARPEIELNIPEQALTVVNVYDITGRKISQLENNVLNAGTHRFEIKNVPNGVYIANVRYGNEVKNIKLNVLKGYTPPQMSSGFSSSNTSNNVVNKTSKSGKGLTILSFEGDANYHAFIDSTFAISSDTTYNMMAFPKSDMDFPLYAGAIATRLDFMKYQWKTDLSPEKILTKPYFDAKIWLDTLNAPTGWKEQARGAVLAWNDSLNASAFQEIPSQYSGSDVSSISVKYINNDSDPYLGNKDGTVSVTEYLNGRPLKWDLYVNTSHGMTDDEKKFVVAHELDRIIHHTARDSPAEEHIINMNTKPFTGISNDDVIIAKCVRNMIPNVRLNNYKQ